MDDEGLIKMPSLQILKYFIGTKRCKGRGQKIMNTEPFMSVSSSCYALKSLVFSFEDCAGILGCVPFLMSTRAVLFGVYPWRHENRESEGG